MDKPRTDELLVELSRKLVDNGRLIEAGWVALAAQWLPAGVPAAKISTLRMAYMAGAQHVFASIMSILEPGEEPTDKDLQRVEKIARELAEFAEELKRDMPGGRR